MASRVSLRISAHRPLVLRGRIANTRCFADKENPGFDPPPGWAGRLADEGETTGPNMEQLPHVSEEAASMAKITGKQGPELEQGTKIQEKAKEDKELQDALPQVMKDQMKKEGSSGGSSGQSRGFSTLARVRAMELAKGSRGFSTVTNVRWEQHQAGISAPDNNAVIQGAEAQQFSNGASFYDEPRNDDEEEEEFDDDEGEFEWEPDEDELQGGLVMKPGNKFGPVELPLPPQSNLRRRYDTIIDQVTKLMMRDGKLSVAQRVCMLNILRISFDLPFSAYLYYYIRRLTY